MITQEQRQLRRSFAGSSDAAAILGCDPYRSAADVWLEKTGRVEDWEGNEATDRGHLLEPVILDWAEGQLNGAFLRDRMKISIEGLLAANFDAIQPGVHVGGKTDQPDPSGVCDEPFVVEAKSTVDDSEWGEPGTDEVPKRVICQVHHQLYVAGPEYRVAYVPVLLPGFKKFDFRMYRIERNDELADMIAAKEIEFMEKYVRADVQPDDFRPSLEVLKRIRREPNKVISIPNVEAVQKWQSDVDEVKNWKARAEESQAAVIALLGDAESALLPDGKQITYMTTLRKAYTCGATSFRTLRLKKGA